MTPTRPALRYHGGKWRLAPWIISHFPPHKVYVEPFGGAASVLLQKAPTRIEVWNDVDQELVSFFRVLRDPVQAEQLRRAIELTPFSRAEQASCFDRSEDAVENARRLIVRSFQSIGARTSEAANGWRTRTPKAVWSPCVCWNGWPESVPLFTARLKEVILESLPRERILEVFDTYDEPDALFYVDPPYPLETRGRRGRNVYANELTDGDHEELCERLLKVRGKVVLSSYANPIYDRILQGWQVITINARAQTNSARVEALYINAAGVQQGQGSLLEEELCAP